MDKRNEILEFLNYIKMSMNRDSILVIYEANKIEYEKCELFNDFTQSLISLIFDTYMGDDFTNKTEQKNHFKWCWDKTVSNFQREGILFKNSKLYDYFINFMFEVFYSMVKNDGIETINENILKLWSFIFDYNNIKNKSDVDTLIEVYKLFDEAINNC